METDYKEVDNNCPTCSQPLVFKENQFYLRGFWFPGLICRDCNALWAIRGNNMWQANQDKIVKGGVNA